MVPNKSNGDSRNILRNLGMRFPHQRGKESRILQHIDAFISRIYIRVLQSIRRILDPQSAQKETRKQSGLKNACVHVLGKAADIKFVCCWILFRCGAYCDRNSTLLHIYNLRLG